MSVLSIIICVDVVTLQEGAENRRLAGILQGWLLPSDCDSSSLWHSTDSVLSGGGRVDSRLPKKLKHSLGQFNVKCFVVNGL